MKPSLHWTTYIVLDVENFQIVNKIITVNEAFHEILVIKYMSLLLAVLKIQLKVIQMTLLPHKLQQEEVVASYEVQHLQELRDHQQEQGPNKGQIKMPAMLNMPLLRV